MVEPDAKGVYFYHSIRSPGLFGALIAKLRPSDEQQQGLLDRIDQFGRRFVQGNIPDTQSSQRHPLNSGQVAPVEKYVLGGGGLIVQPAIKCLSNGVYQITPHVLHSRDHIICFDGRLSNLPDMLNAQMCRSIGRRRGSSTGSSTHYVGAGDDDTVSPFAATHPTATDTCTQTTSLLLALCEEHGLDSEGGLLLLSELQGRYCLIAYDANKHQSFAARSPGAGPLYYCLGPDGALSLTNSLSTLPPEEKASDWNELPPGHCIAGKQPRVVQYALTRSQLDLRVYEEEAVDAVAAAIKQELRGDAGGSSGGGSGLGGSSPTGSGLLEALSRRLSRDAVPWYSHEK